MDEVTIAASQAPLLGVPAATMRSWVKRGKLFVMGYDRFNRPLYSLADVRELAARRVAKRPSGCNA